MKVVKITYPTPLSEIEEADNDNIDIFVELEDGNIYTLVITTPNNIKSLIEKSNQDFFDAGPPMLIVRELTERCITNAVNSYSMGEAYWLKEYHLSGSFTIETLNEMIRAEKE